MISQTFFKLTAVLSTCIFLSGISMESTKKSTYTIPDNAIPNNVDHNLHRPLYNADVTQLTTAINTNKPFVALSILKQIINQIPNYTQDNINNLVLLIKDYTERLYTNELIGLYLFGTLAKHKDILLQIEEIYAKKLNNPGGTELTTKSTKRLVAEEILATQETLQPVSNFASDIQKKIDTIAQARVLKHLDENKVAIGVDNKTLKKSVDQWGIQFIKRVKATIATKNVDELNRLWEANFNDNHKQFKVREIQIRDRIIEQLEKAHADTKEIRWFKKHTTQLVYKKEPQIPLKSQAQTDKSQTDQLLDELKRDELKKEFVETVTATLRELKVAHDHKSIVKSVDDLANIFQTEICALNKSDITNIKFAIDEKMRYLYQDCLLGSHGNGEQKLQLDIFDICSDKLIGLGALLRAQLGESEEATQKYIQDAQEQKKVCLFEIKVIRDSGKIADSKDISIWKDVAQTKLISDVERQNEAAIQKTIQANFNASTVPQLAEHYDEIINNIKESCGNGKDNANADWLNKHEKLFIPINKPYDIPVPPAPPGTKTGITQLLSSIYKTGKDHWILSSFGIAIILVGIYSIWEEWNTEDEAENDNKPADEKKEAHNKDNEQKNEAASAEKQTKVA